MVRNNTNHQPMGAGYRNALAAGRSLVTTRSKASLRSMLARGGMWITYAQVSYLSTVIKSAILCISLATFYSLTNVSWVFQRRRSKRHETNPFPPVLLGYRHPNAICRYHLEHAYIFHSQLKGRS